MTKNHPYKVGIFKGKASLLWFFVCTLLCSWSIRDIIPFIEELPYPKDSVFFPYLIIFFTHMISFFSFGIINIHCPYKLLKNKKFSYFLISTVFFNRFFPFDSTLFPCFITFIFFHRQKRICPHQCHLFSSFYTIS